MLFVQKFEVIFFFQLLAKNSPIRIDESFDINSCSKGLHDFSGLKNPSTKFLNTHQQFLFYQKFFNEIPNVVFLRFLNYTDYFIVGFYNFETFQIFFLNNNVSFFQQHNLIFSEIFFKTQAFYLIKIQDFFKKPFFFFEKKNIPGFFYNKAVETIIGFRHIFYHPIVVLAVILKTKHNIVF